MATISQLTHEAGFVFEGKIEKLGASTTPRFPASSDTAIVSVVKVHKSTDVLARYGGQQITVQLKSPVNLNAGQSAIFFTHGIHYGQSMVVRELGNVPQAANIETQLNSAVQEGNDTDITQRLAQSDLVITGVAAAPRRVEQQPGHVISEHDPDWWVSTVNVETVEKGQSPGATKDVVFAHSKDIRWYKSPKINEGDRRVWLLHSRPIASLAAPTHTVVHPLDSLPIENLERVRGLLKANARA